MSSALPLLFDGGMRYGFVALSVVGRDDDAVAGGFTVVGVIRLCIDIVGGHANGATDLGGGMRVVADS